MSREPADVQAFMQSYRSSVERSGQLLSTLEGVRQDGPLGLPGCTKVYLPDADGRHSVIYRFIRVRGGELVLGYLAFGQRHSPANSPKWTVYELAYARLHGRAPERPH